MQWGGETADNQFQLAIFDLGGGSFAMEFNYAQITAGSDATSSIGYDNGAGTSTNLLLDLGDLLGLWDALSFDAYEGVGADGNTADFCETPATILACNNYFAQTSVFGPLASVLPGSFDGFFRRDPSFGIDAQGRYLFLIENEVIEVPEPPTTELLLMGLFGVAVMLRKRRRGEPARERSHRRRDGL